MATATAASEPVEARAVRRGSRWLHAAPDEDEVRTWFDKQRLHKEMEHERYVSGIVLISATERVKQTVTMANGATATREVEQAVFTPYVKVDTRIAYFWDLLLSLNDGELLGNYVGVIEPVAVPIIQDTASPYYNGHLPKGFFIYPVRNRDDSISRFIAHSRRVAIYERESYGKDGALPLLEGVGTKQTTMARQWADDNALMKAETGATGRALGMAGILVIGTGVATAEDMQEAAAGPSGALGAASEGPTLPEDIQAAAVGGRAFPEGPLLKAVAEPIVAAVEAEQREQARTEWSDPDLRAYALTMTEEFERDYPQEWTVFREWWVNDRKLGKLEEVGGPVLKGAVTKLERDLDTARQSGKPAPTAGQ